MNNNEIDSFIEFLTNKFNEYEIFSNELIDKINEYKSLNKFLKKEKEKDYKKNIKRKELYDRAINNINKIINVANGKNEVLDDYIFYFLYSQIYLYIEQKVMKNKSFDSLFVNGKDNSSRIYDLNIIATNLVKYFITILKQKGIKHKVLNCFDENGEIDINKYNNYSNFINNVKSNALVETIGEHCRQLFISKDLFTQARTLSRLELERIESEERERKEKERQASKKFNEREKIKDSIKQTELSQVENSSVVNKDVYKYIDPVSEELKVGVSKIIKWDDLFELLKTIPSLTKGKLNSYYNAYMKEEKNIYFLKLLDFFYGSLSKDDLVTLRGILSKSTQRDNENFVELFKNVTDSDYRNSSEDEKIEEISGFLYNTRKIVDNTITTNLYIFPNKNFIESELDRISKNKNGSKKSFARKGINMHLSLLKSTEEVKLREIKDMFHIIKTNNSYPRDKEGSLKIVSSKLKKDYSAHRFGKGKTKVVYVKLSVSEANQKALKEKFNCTNNPQLYYIFSLENVSINDEDDYYEYICSISNKIFDDLAKYESLLSNDFTSNDKLKEFNEVCLHISNSFSQLDESIKIQKEFSKEIEVKEEIVEKTL